MPSCPTCGSPSPDGQIVCEFCGHTLRKVSDPADEIRAVQELGNAWAKVGQTATNSNNAKGLFGVAARPI
jgi:hypothetical protein